MPQHHQLGSVCSTFYKGTWVIVEDGLIQYAVASFTSAAALGFLVSGVHSDIFGRRLFIIIGSMICCAGFIITATAYGPKQFIAGISVIGFGSGNVQIVCFHSTETSHVFAFHRLSVAVFLFDSGTYAE